MKKLEDLDKSYFGPRVSDGAGVYVAGFVFLYIFQAIALVVASFAGVNIENLKEAPVWFTWVIMIVNQCALVLAVWAYGKVAHKPLLNECKINVKLHWKQAAIIPLIVVASIMAFLPLAEGFVRLVTLITKEQPTVDLGIGTKWWEILISVLFMSVLPAIGEELLFRGGVARGLKRKNYVFAIVLSGFMFSIFHGNAAQTVHQFLIGMVFAYLYFVTGSLLASIFAHFLNNALAVALEAIFINVKIEMSVGSEIAVYVVMSLIGFVGLYFLLRFMMKVSKETKGIEQTEDKLAWAKDFKNAFTLSGIKENYNKLNSSLKTLFDDSCDMINLDGDLEKAEKDLDFQGQNQQSKEKALDNSPSKDEEFDKLLEEANKQTIRKRKRFDLYSLLAAVGIALAIWIMLLIP